MSGTRQTILSRTTHHAQQTIALGRALAAHLRAGDVLALSGELGAGKTQLVRGLAEGLGVSDSGLASPTFVMVHEYLPAEDAPHAPVLVHIDAYRLKSLEDLESIGFSPVGDDPLGEMRQGAVVVIEWAERVLPHLGEDRLEIQLTHQGETERLVEVLAGEAWAQRLREFVNDSGPKGAGLAKQVPGEFPGVRACPVCQGAVIVGTKYEPFCSERCKLVDLGKWLGGKYIISRPVEQRDLEEGVD